MLTSEDFYRINSLEDAELEQWVQDGTKRAQLAEYFGGEEEYEFLRRLIRESPVARLDSRPVFGESGVEIILLPGIMGSELEDKTGDFGKVWLNFKNLLVNGTLSALLLDAAGQKDEERTSCIEPIGLYQGSYKQIQKSLSNQGIVYPFAYDWRKSINLSAHQLRDFVEEKGKDNPEKQFVFVAHSMGGLVVRRYLDLFGVQAHKRVYKLIMLGTPNHGSYLPMKVMTGQGSITLKIAGVRYGKELLQGIIQSFPGLYEMLPNPDLEYFAQPKIYEKTYWGEDSINAQHLDAAKQFHQGIQACFPNKMVLIANNSLKTVTHVEREINGQHKFFAARVGDDTVPFKSAYLEGVPTYLTQAKHSKIQQDHEVLEAINDLIEGITPDLPRYRPVFGGETSIELQEIDPDEFFFEF